MSDSMVVIPLDDARRFIDPNIGFDRNLIDTSRKRKPDDPASYKLARHISEGNKRINQKRKEPYHPVEPEEYMLETPPRVIPKYDGEPSALHEPEVIEESLYDEIIEKLTAVGAVDEEGNIYKKNGITKSGNAILFIDISLFINGTYRC